MLRPVVDYDSCTDEEEVNSIPDNVSTVVNYDGSSDDDDVVCLSVIPNKKTDVTFNMTPSATHEKRENSQFVSTSIGFENRDIYDYEQSYDSLGKSEGLPLTELYLPMNVTVNVKRKVADAEESHQDFHNDFATGTKKVKQSDRIENILPVFNESHTYSAQQGLGFRKENLGEDLSENPHSSYSNGLKKHLPKKDYKSLSFIKSDHVLELSTPLSGEIKTGVSNENSLGQVTLQNTLSPVSTISDNQVAGSSTPVIKELFSNVAGSSTSVIKGLFSNVAGSSTPVVKELISNVAESKESSVPSFDDEEDSIEVIDRALCEALEAKKNATKVSKSNKMQKMSQPLNSPSTSNNSANNSSETTTNNSNISGEIGSSILIQKQILEDSTTLMSKLRFICNMYPNLRELHDLLIQSQTRITDWKIGALNKIYFLTRMEEVGNYVNRYENSICNQDWTCSWDSYHERYYFINRRTGIIKDTYPGCSARSQIARNMHENNQHQQQASQHQQPANNILNNNVAEHSTPDIVNERNSTIKITSIQDELKVTSDSLYDASPPPPPPGVDTPPPPPPYSPLPHSPPPPPPDNSEDVCDLPEDMDLENSNDSSTHPIISNDTAFEVDQLQYSSMTASLSSNMENHPLETCVDSISSTLQTSCGDSNVISDIPQIFPLSSCSSINETLTLPSELLSSKTTKEDKENSRTIAMPVCLQSDNNLDLCQSSSSLIQSNLSEEIKGKVTQTTSRPAPKKEKKKTKLLSVLALKKKNIPLLVEKWQKIKEEQEKEDKSDRS